MKNLKQMSIENLCINTIRTLSMDGVQQAKSGHPGTPMALAPLVYTLWTKYLSYNPQNPDWANRDRFVLSAGHASMLIYSILHIAGYDLPLDELKKFRQLGSKTAGHPEFGLAPGVETTTGPLGQGISNSVGMAIAEAHLAAVYNKEKYNIIDHYTYAVCGDGDLMEGVSHEAASLAGHFGLGKLMWFYDDNHITIEGKTDLAYSDDVQKRFEGYGWHVINIGDNANNLEAISNAIADAKKVTDKPSLIIIRTHIGFGSPNFVDTSTAHGAPLGEDEVKLTKKAYGWPEDEKFLVPEKVLEHMKQFGDKGKTEEKQWNENFAAYEKEYPELAKQLKTAIAGELPDGWDSLVPEFKPEDGPAATRNISGKVINAITEKVPYLVGGSADLSPSTKTLLKNSDYFGKNEYENRNIPWGVREFGMCGAANGLILHGGLRPFTSTFFVFTDYARPAIRLAAIMKLPVIYVMTHDSIGVGEDGPTHQPVEQMASFRLMPNVHVIRPGDANEVSYAWRAAMQRKDGPTMMLLTRQNIPVFDQAKLGSAKGVLKGAYVLSKEKGDKPDVILMASGSEIEPALEAQEKLAEENIDARVVSMPCWELFREQSLEYRNSVLPPEVKARLAVEAGVSFGWKEWVGDNGDTVTIDQFGESGPYKKVFEHFGFSVDAIVKKAKTII